MKFQAFHVNPGEKLKKKDVNNDLSNFMSVFPSTHTAHFFSFPWKVWGTNLLLKICFQHKISVSSAPNVHCRFYVPFGALVYISYTIASTFTHPENNQPKIPLKHYDLR